MIAGRPPGTGSAYRQCEAGGWLIELLPPNSYSATFTPGKAIIGFSFDCQVGTHAFGSDRKTHFRSIPNGLAFVPVGCDVFSQSETGGEYLKITQLRPNRRITHCERRFSDAVDPASIAAAYALRRILLADARPDALACEEPVSTLLEGVLTRLEMTVNRKPAGGWMTPQRLRLIDDLIEANLASKLSVHDLAGALGLSTGFFSRALKAAVGRSPHDYIVDRRIARARALLRASHSGLSAIALEVGFASHAHMAEHFRRRLGLSPSRVRAGS